MKAKDTETIERYLNGLLPEAEKRQFEEQLGRDEALRQEVALQRAIRQAVLEAGPTFEADILGEIDLNQKDEELREQFRQQGERLKKAAEDKSGGSVAKSRKLFPRRQLLAIAASILFLIVAGGLWWVNSTYSDKALAGSYYLEPDTPGTLSGDPSSSAALTSALQLLLVEQDYEGAEVALKSIGPDRPEYLQAQYFLGHVYFQQKDFESAVGPYREVFNATDLPAYINRDKVQWNLLLAQLGAGRPDAAFREQLDDLAKNGTPPFRDKAQQLRDQLNSFWAELTF